MESSACNDLVASVPSSMPLSLQHLPLELLRMIAASVFDRSNNADGSNRDQHAFRAACKATRDATTPLITCMAISIDAPPLSSRAVAASSQGLQQLACFPRACSLSSLRWSFQDGNGPHEWPHTVYMADLLPSFLHGAGDRLLRLQNLHLSGHAAFLSTDLAALVPACPQLTRLHFHDVPTMGPALQPLSALASLRELSLEDVRVHDGAAVCRSLRSLSQLTRLHIACDDVEAWEDGTAECILLGDALSGVSTLVGLHSLHLELPCSDDGNLATLTRLKPLTRLTSLTLRLAYQSSLSGDDLSAAGLPSMPDLAALSFPGVTLEPSAMQLLYGLPKLAELDVCLFDRPDPSAFRDHAATRTRTPWELTVEFPPSPRTLAALPPSGLSHLHCEHFDCNFLDWGLVAGEDARAAAAPFRAAAELLALRAPDAVGVHLHWGDATLPSLVGPAQQQLLASLSPFHTHGCNSFRLRLGAGWALDAQVLGQLVDRLPNLQTLEIAEVGVGGWQGFANFVAAVGSALHVLRHFHIPTWSTKLSLQLPDKQSAQCAALLGMAAGRGNSGKALFVSVGGVPEGQVGLGAEYNALVAADSRGLLSFTFTTY